MTRPNILFVGGSKGSWQVRGRQLAAAIPNAAATVRPRPENWTWADVVVLVKRAPETWWRQAAESCKPIVWDVLDFWRQPSANDWPEAKHLAVIDQIRRECNASILLGATHAMVRSIGGLYLPHHSRVGLIATPPRAKAKVVAYDGNARYLGTWRPALERACQRLGLMFVINPSDLRAADVLVAFRGEQWDGWACREWKSGVKYVNAIAAGRPIVTQPCAAAAEIAPSGYVVDRQEDLTDALSLAATVAAREQAFTDGQRRAPSSQIDVIAKAYAQLLHHIAERAA